MGVYEKRLVRTQTPLIQPPEKCVDPVLSKKRLIVQHHKRHAPMVLKLRRLVTSDRFLNDIAIVGNPLLKRVEINFRVGRRGGKAVISAPVFHA